MHKDLFVRICWYGASLLLTMALVVRLAVLVATPHSRLAELIDFIYDDGYYYLGIAANMADIGRSTLDGTTATNGYQPLWLLLLFGLARLVGTEPHRFFIASCAFIYLIAGSSPLLVLFWRKSPWRQLALYIGTGVAIVVIQQPNVFLEGLEPILIAPLVIPLVMLIERKTDAKTLLQLSAVLAGCFLVRLDALALYGAAIICLPLSEMLGDGLHVKNLLRRTIDVALKLSIIVVPTVVTYLAINQWLFGSPVPVSGLAKLLGGARFSNWGVIEMLFSRWHSLALLLAILLPLEALARMSARRPEPLLLRSLLVVSLALCLQCFYYAAFSAWNVWPWYAYLVAVDMALLIARILYLSSLLYSHQRARLAALAAVAIVGMWAANRSATFAFRSLNAQLQSKFSVLTKFGLGAAQGASTVSFNQVSLEMLNDFFAADRHTTIAMGDRAGGIAYWGRNKLSVVQSEGLTLDIAYLNARSANTGEQYFATRFPIEYWVVDREVIPTVQDANGQTQFVIPEPIQGRITKAPVPVFCFPATAIRYQQHYAATSGRNTRMVFSFAERVPCSVNALSLVRAVEQGIGLRQFSLPSEYDPSQGGTMNKRGEDRDRHYQGQR